MDSFYSRTIRGEFAVKRLALLDIGNPLFVVFKKYVNENMGGGSFLRFVREHKPPFLLHKLLSVRRLSIYPNPFAGGFRAGQVKAHM